MRISDWSSDVCSSDLATTGPPEVRSPRSSRTRGNSSQFSTPTADRDQTVSRRSEPSSRTTLIGEQPNPWDLLQPQDVRSEEHTSELQSLMRTSYAVFCLKKKNKYKTNTNTVQNKETH